MLKVSRNYRAWDVKLSNYPNDGNMREKIIFFTKFGILAASIHNTQPWSFTIEMDSLTISPNKKYQLKASDPSGNNIYISLGCFITNIEAVAKKFGFYTTIRKLKTNNDILSKLTFTSLTKKDDNLSGLADVITRRYSNKRAYLNKPVEKKKIELLSLEKISTIESIFINEKTLISQIAKLQKNAVKSVASKDFTTELSYWVAANNTTRGDGMPGFVEGFSAPKALIGKFSLKYFPFLIVNLLAKKNKVILENSPLIGIIHSQTIDKGIAIDVGRLYQRIALRATNLNLQCTPMHAIIEDKKGSESLMKLLNLPSTKPRFLFRIGYSNTVPYHTPRRELATFISEL